MRPLVPLADLRFVATSDVHMHLTGWDALQDRMVPGRGMDALATCIQTARRTAPGAVVVVDNGDALQGTPLGETCADPGSDEPHPWAAVLNALEYDCIGLGNHDFDFGIPFLERVLRQVDAPVLCASLAEGKIRGVAETTLLHRDMTCSDGEVRGLVIGVTSVLPPQTAIWNHRHLAGRIAFHDGVAAASRAVADLRIAGADVVLVLCHSGMPARGVGDTENFAATLARDVPGIDALVLGHTHKRFPTGPGESGGDLYDVPAVMPGYSAEVLGQIDLRLAWSDLRWQVVGHSATLVSPDRADTTTAPAITALAAPAIARTRAALDQRLGRTEPGFHSYFEMLQSGTAAMLLARAMTRAIASRVAGSDLARLPLIASVALQATGGHAGPSNYVTVPPGAVRARHLAMISTYPNAIWAAVLTGADLWQWAERAAAYFAPEVEPTGRLINPDAPSFNFDILHGLETVFDPSGPARFDPVGNVIDPTRHRVRALLHGGVPVDPKSEFLVAMSSYRGAGGGGFPGLDRPARLLQTEIDLMTALREEVLGHPLPTGPVPSAWRFAPDLRLPVVIETAPEAMRHLDDIARFEPQVIGVNDAGFLELRVTI